MTNNTDIQSPFSVLISLATLIGSLSALEATSIVIATIFTVAVGVSAIRRNNAQREYFESANRKNQTRQGIK